MTSIVKQERRSRISAAAALCFLAACSAWGGGAALAQSLPERIKQCEACHGPGGVSTTERVPSLAGQPEFFTLNQLILMREGVRKVEQMGDIAKGLKDEEIQALSSHFAKAPAKASAEKIDPDLVAKGGVLAQRLRCASCHLPTLEGQEQMPRLAKQRVDYMLEAMKQYRDNRRSGADTAMTAVIVGVSDDDLTALAQYAASR